MTTEVTASATAEDTTSRDAWEGFVRGPWAEDIDVRDFIQRNYTPSIRKAARNPPDW